MIGSVTVFCGSSDAADPKYFAAAVELGEKLAKRKWRLIYGVGIAHGAATLGAIGFEGRWDYGAIGPVSNLAARLCAEAKPGQVLISHAFLSAVEALLTAEPVGELALKGFAKPVSAFNVLGLRER